MAMQETRLQMSGNFRTLAVIKNNGSVRTDENRGVPYLKSTIDSRPVKIHDPKGLIRPSEKVVFVKPK